MRLTFGELAGRRRQRDVVLLLRIPQSSVRAVSSNVRVDASRSISRATSVAAD